MKELLFISQDREMALIQEMIYKIKMRNWNIHPSKTCFLCISPDYSSIVTQHLSHALSEDHEIYFIESVNVPFPDQAVEQFKTEFETNYSRWHQKWENFVLVEAGVIRGGNYTWITESIKNISPKPVFTLALCENIHSKFKSDLVCLYYDAEIKDLHFWWEQPNSHWK
jgi:hypothetical protein